MTNSMKIYAAISEIQQILLTLQNTTDEAFWPNSLKKAQSLISNAEYNQAQAVARQALADATKEKQ